MTTIGTTTLTLPSPPLAESLLFARLTPVAAVLTPVEVVMPMVAAAALASPSALACDAEAAERRLAAAADADADAAAAIELTAVGTVLLAADACCGTMVPLEALMAPLLLLLLLGLALAARLPPLLLAPLEAFVVGRPWLLALALALALLLAAG